ncbi:MAG: hypothetical protein LQ340_007682, partial [Diploschistes diacapsis]
DKLFQGKRNADKQIPSEPSDKGSPKRTIEQQVTVTASDKSVSPLQKTPCHPVAFWASYSKWPPNFTEKGREMAESPSKKRRHSSSYSQDVKDGNSSRAYSPGYQKEMAEKGMIMDLFQLRAVITADSQQLCINLLSGGNQTPTDLLPQSSCFGAVVQRAQDRNEARVARDILPLIVPSAELLCIRENMADSDSDPQNITQVANEEDATGLKDNLKVIIEEVNAEWVKSGVIYGPRPQPDFAAGLQPSAFTRDEIQQLKRNHTDRCPSYMTENMYFPFLVCEVKSSGGVLVEAERETMHSASIATRAIVELYRKVSREQELYGRILVISISLDHSMVTLYGHYAHMADQNLLFFRHHIDTFQYTRPNGGDRWKAYNFTRRVYAYFVRIHLERIRSALSSLPSLRPESVYEVSSDNNTEVPESQASLTSIPPSQRAGSYKEHSLLESVLIRNENNKLRQEMQERERLQQEREREQQEQLRSLHALFLQQEERMKEQMEMMRLQMDVVKQQQEGKKDAGGGAD